MSTIVELNKPSTEFLPSYLEFIDEMKHLGEQVWEQTIPAANESPTEFVRRLIQAEVSPRHPLVPETTYWATIGNQVVGRIALRHRLNENLAEFGGHIGYEVRPSFRRQGIAKEILRQILATPKAKEIGKLLLTCSPTNVASNKTILANGGVLAKTIFVERFKRDTNQYWIDLHR